jgi:hypothetical protein
VRAPVAALGRAARATLRTLSPGAGYAACVALLDQPTAAVRELSGNALLRAWQADQTPDDLGGLTRLPGERNPPDRHATGKGEEVAAENVVNFANAISPNRQSGSWQSPAS